MLLLRQLIIAHISKVIPIPWIHHASRFSIGVTSIGAVFFPMRSGTNSYLYNVQNPDITTMNDLKWNTSYSTNIVAFFLPTKKARGKKFPENLRYFLGWPKGRRLGSPNCFEFRWHLREKLRKLVVVVCSSGERRNSSVFLNNLSLFISHLYRPFGRGI